MSGNMMKLDANETAFFKRQTEYVKSKTYDKKYRNLKAKSMIPVSTEAPSGSQFITWYSYSKIGLAKIIASYAHDFPRVDIYGEENTAKVYGQGASYGYSIVEIRRAQRAGMNLSTKRAEAARRAIEELQDKLAWDGDSDYNIQGLIDYPGITEATLTTGTGGNTWDLKTPDEIVADVTALRNAVSVPTRGVEEIDTIILPREQYNIIADTRMTDGDSKTILSYLLENIRKQVPSFMIAPVDRLDTAGDGGVTRMMGYVKDPDHLVQEIPQMFEQFEADKKGMEYEIPCHAEHGGVVVYYPESVAYMDGI